MVSIYLLCFFFKDTATTEIYTLSLHDALPISLSPRLARCAARAAARSAGSPPARARPPTRDRKSTRLNSSHSQISYAVFCLKKKKTQTNLTTPPQQLPQRRTHCPTHTDTHALR